MMETQQPSSELVSLCGKLRDEIISDEEFERLQSMLVSDPKSLWFYRQFSTLCSGLEQISQADDDSDTATDDSLIGNFRWTDDLSDLSPVSPFANSVDRTLVPGSLPSEAKPNRRFAVITSVLIGLAACVAFALVSLRPESSTEGFASVVDQYQAVWGEEASPHRIAGKRTLISGAARLRFDSGAELLVQAPAEFSIDQVGLATLNRGSLRLYVPPAATGFQIQTPYGLVVDHGTRIGVCADQVLGLEVHVYEGLAEAIRYQFKSKADLLKNPNSLPFEKSPGEMLSAGQAIAIPTGRKPARRMAASETYFASALDQHDDLPLVSGDVQLLVSPPRSVRRVRNELVDLGRAAIFSERKDFDLTEDLPVTLTGPNQSIALESLSRTLPTGTRVDSMMVHFALPKSKRSGSGELTASGVIEFPRPVVGVVCERPGKQADLIGNPSTDYPRDRNTGLEDAIDGDPLRADQIEISEDRKTVRFSLRIHGREAAEQADFVDQFRVLIESASSEDL